MALCSPAAHPSGATERFSEEVDFCAIIPDLFLVWRRATLNANAAHRVGKSGRSVQTQIQSGPFSCFRL